MQESVSYASSLLSVRRSFLENQDEDSFMFKQRGGELGRFAQSVYDTATHDPESRHGEKNELQACQTVHNYTIWSIHSITVTG